MNKAYENNELRFQISKITIMNFINYGYELQSSMNYRHEFHE